MSEVHGDPKESKHQPQQDEWRKAPGYVLEVLNSVPAGDFCHSRFSQYQVLLGEFLFSMKPSPLTDKPLFITFFDWGRIPLEKVVDNIENLQKLALSPFASRNSVSIIEPCQFVGYSTSNRGVRASKNIAYHLQMIANCDSVLFPLWKSGIQSDPHSIPTEETAKETTLLPLELLLPVMSASRAVIVEGGDACAYESDSFSSPLKHSDLDLLFQNLILNRLQMRSPSIFICLGHQMACDAITRLVARVIDEVRICHAQSTLDCMKNGKICPNWLEDLREECLKIDSIGNSLIIGENIRGYRHRQFTVCSNLVTEVGKKRLVPFTPLEKYPIPRRLLRAHKLTTHRYDQHNLLSTIMNKYGVRIDCQMFHSDRVNFEAVLFDNWALQRIHSLLVYHRGDVVRSSLSWTLNLPCGIEVCASTAFPEESGKPLRIHTATAAAAIFYEDFETTAVKSSFTLQFHPELCDGINCVGDEDQETGFGLHDMGKELEGLEYFLNFAKTVQLAKGVRIIQNAFVLHSNFNPNSTTNDKELNALISRHGLFKIGTASTVVLAMGARERTRSQVRIDNANEILN